MSAPDDTRLEVPSREAQERDERRLGFDRTRNYFTEVMRPLVPQRLAVLGTTLDVVPSKERYRPGEPIDFDVVFYNRLPMPVEIATPTSRCWFWKVDDEPFASDEWPYIQDRPNSFQLRARERKRFAQRWDGRFRREGSPTRWVPASPGAHTIGAVLETVAGTTNPSAEAEIYIES